MGLQIILFNYKNSDIHVNLFHIYVYQDESCVFYQKLISQVINMTWVDKFVDDLHSNHHFI